MNQTKNFGDNADEASEKAEFRRRLKIRKENGGLVSQATETNIHDSAGPDIGQRKPKIRKVINIYLIEKTTMYTLYL